MKIIEVIKCLLRLLKLRFTLYCDFECLVPSVLSCNKENQKTTKYQNHIPSQFMLHLVSKDPDFHIEPVIYSGEDADLVLLQKLSELLPTFKEKIKQNKPMIITKEQEKEFRKETICHICKKEIKNGSKTLSYKKYQLLQEEIKKMNKEEKEKLYNFKVRDHDHITGLYRGCAHAYCNLTYKVPPFIPVIFHNLKGYDAHFILKSANKPEFKFKNNSCIPLN